MYLLKKGITHNSNVDIPNPCQNAFGDDFRKRYLISAMDGMYRGVVTYCVAMHLGFKLALAFKCYHSGIALRPMP